MEPTPLPGPRPPVPLASSSAPRPEVPEGAMADPLFLAGEFQGLLVSVGPLAPLLIAAAALIEYLFPPFPGDTVTLVGGVMAVSGAVSWPLVVVALTVGNVGGIVIDWQVGRLLARRRHRLPAGEHDRPWWQPLSRERFERFEVSYRRHGPLLLVVNRFLPAARAFFFLAAGAAGLSLRTTLLYGLVSAAVWSALVLGLGALLGGNLEAVLRVVTTLGTAGWIALAALVLGFLAWRSMRNKRSGSV